MLRCTTFRNAKHRVLFFGVDPVSLPSLQRLRADYFGPQTVVSRLEVVRPGPPVADAPKLRELLEGLQIHEGLPADISAFDLGIVVAFGKFLRPSTIHSFQNGVINMHPSLLPRFRGPSPIQTAIMDGCVDTGVSIMRIVPGPVDSGPILLQKAVRLGRHTGYFEAREVLAEVGAEAVWEVLQDVPRHMQAAAEQDHTLATSTKLLADRHPVWFNQPAERVYNLWRGLQGNGGVHCLLQRSAKSPRLRFKLEELSLELPPSTPSLGTCPPGTVFFPPASPTTMLIRCGAEADWISCRAGGVTGKKTMTAKELLGGYFQQKGIAFPPETPSGPCLWPDTRSYS